MLQSIQIKNTASYGDTPQSLNELKKFNFIYGSNGTGKTTISRVISDKAAHPECALSWQNGSELETKVYNRDFVERNFSPSTALKGIFTLGEKNKELLDKIDALKIELTTMKGVGETYTKELQGETGTGGKQGDLAKVEGDFKEVCWSQIEKYGSKFLEAFNGFRGSKDSFKAKVLQEASNNSANLRELVELENRAQSLFVATPEMATPLTEINWEVLLALESNPILTKAIIGKADVDIAAMIQKLGNSDWVKEGRPFFETNDQTCPFCQQKTESSFSKSLNEYFDEQFEADTKAITQLHSHYLTESSRLIELLRSILAIPSKFLDAEKFKVEVALLDTKIRLNIQQIEKKRKELSQRVSLEPLSEIIDSIKIIIAETNASIKTHNEMVANFGKEKDVLKKEVWKYLLEVEIKAQLVAYKSKKIQIENEIRGLSVAIQEKQKSSSEKHAEIQKLEKNTTSIQPTIDKINALLLSFGFHRYKLQKSDSSQHYKIVRPDGSSAKETLSEGERSFITFLYFYHLLHGSESEVGGTYDQVVVFDDPVSSLDSDALFIVSSLIKKLIHEVHSNSGAIKQIFVLTHNVYFHKEVTFLKIKGLKPQEKTFWITRNKDQFSIVQGHKSNPIKTSYELLWSEVRNENRSNLSIQNTLRRILEHYFKILGNIDDEAIIHKFEGQERTICRSLFSWINDGSHSAHDDVFITLDTELVPKYLEVFKAIFEKSNHLSHYEMMMGNSEESRE